MGKLINEGLQTSAKDAPQPTSFLMGRNLRKSSTSPSPNQKRVETSSKMVPSTTGRLEDGEKNPR